MINIGKILVTTLLNIGIFRRHLEGVKLYIHACIYIILQWCTCVLDLNVIDTEEHLSAYSDVWVTLIYVCILI